MLKPAGIARQLDELIEQRMHATDNSFANAANADSAEEAILGCVSDRQGQGLSAEILAILRFPQALEAVRFVNNTSREFLVGLLDGEEEFDEIFAVVNQNES